MNIAATIKNDYLFWDDLEPISLLSNFAPGDGIDTAYPIPSAMRRALTYKELATSNGAYTAQDLIWEIPAVLLQQKVADTNNALHAIVPKPGDQIIDANQVAYTILEAPLEAVGTVYRCVTRDMMIAWQLQDTIDIEQSGITYDADGASVRGWPSGPIVGGSILYNDLACRVQPIDAHVVNARGLEGQETKYTIYLSQQLTLGLLDVRECRIYWANAPGAMPDTFLDIVNYRNSARIDELPIIEATGKV